MAELLVSLALTLRSMEYVMSVAKPSGAGLKLELERFGRHVEDVFRDRKKDAEEMVAAIKEEWNEPRQDEGPSGR
jgi:hypothetical protein